MSRKKREDIKRRNEVKEKLMAVTRVDRRIRIKLDQIAELRDLAVRTRRNFSDMPGNPNPNVSRLEEVMIKIVDMESDLEKDIKVLLDLKRQSGEYIKQVKNPDAQAILELRYLADKKWEQIAVEMNYNLRQVYRIHDNALDEITIQ